MKREVGRFALKLLYLTSIVAPAVQISPAQKPKFDPNAPIELITEGGQPVPRANSRGPQSGALRKDIPTIAKDAKGAIVSIVMSDKQGKPIAQGSGFLVSKDGLIMTNYHVIAEGSSAVVKFPDGAFYVVDGVLVADKARDIAVIKAQGQNFRTLSLGDSNRVQVGEEVVAIGNPLSLESTVSNGIVSGVRNVKEEGGKFLQITAPISPGSSGGPLFNIAGEVIGITTMYLKGGENLNFAIPINDAKQFLRSDSSKLQNFPNETRPEPQQEQRHNEESNAETLPTLDQKTACDALAERAYRKYVATTPVYHDGQSYVRATYSSHLDVKSSTCFLIVFQTLRLDIKFANGTPDVKFLQSILVSDAIEGTQYGQFTQVFKPGEEFKKEELASGGFVVPLDGDYGKAISITAHDNATGTAWFRVALLKLLGIHLKVE